MTVILFMGGNTGIPSSCYEGGMQCTFCDTSELVQATIEISKRN